MTSSNIKLKILLFGSSNNERANLINSFYLWSKNQDILTCLTNRKGIVQSKYLESDPVEEAKFEDQTKPFKTYNFQLKDQDQNKDYDITFVDIPRWFEEGQDRKGIQSLLSRDTTFDCVLLALNTDDASQGHSRLKDILETLEKCWKNRLSEKLILLINGEESMLKEDSKSLIEQSVGGHNIFFYQNEILDIDSEIILKDSAKYLEMNEKVKKVVLKVLHQIWMNALNTYKEHKKIMMKKILIKRKYQVIKKDDFARDVKVKRIKSQQGQFMYFSFGDIFESEKLLKMIRNFNKYQQSSQKRLHLKCSSREYTIFNSKMLRQILHRSKSIQSLKLVWPIFGNSASVCASGSENLRKGIGKLTRLKSLSLQFEKSMTDLGELEEIMAGLKRLHSLKNCSVMFPAAGVASSVREGGLGYFHKGIKRLPSFEGIDFNLNGSYNGMTLEKMKNICLGLDKFSHLKSLKLLMHGSRGVDRLDDNGIEHLSGCLSRHLELKSLHLDFSGTSVTNYGFQAFCKTLRKLTDIRSLTLLFVNNESISEKEFKVFCESLQSLQGLEELNLNFSYCPLLTCESLDDLRKTIERLADLHTVNLLFVWCKEISIQDMSQLKKSLLAKKSYKSLVARR